MAADKKFDVFLSHNSKDKAWVIKLKEALEVYGIKVWLDKEEIRPGEIFAQELEMGIAESRALALVISPEAMNSGWVKAEYYRALNLATNGELQLIPVLYKNAEIPGFLSDRLWVDFSDETKYDENVRELIWGITGKKPLLKPAKEADTKSSGVSSNQSPKGTVPRKTKPNPVVVTETPKPEPPPPPQEPATRPYERYTSFIIGALTLAALVWVIQYGISTEFIMVPAGLIKWISASGNPWFALWAVSTMIASTLLTLPILGVREGLLNSLASLNRTLFIHVFGLRAWVTIPIIVVSALSLVFVQPICQSPTATIQFRDQNNEMHRYDGEPISVVPGSHMTLIATSDDTALISCSWSSVGTAVSTLDQKSKCSTRVQFADRPGRSIVNLALSKSSCSTITSVPLEIIIVP